MSRKNIKCLCSSVSKRVPSNRTNLMPGVHWVWNSLRTKSLKLSMLMILSGHVVDCQDINCRSNPESILSKYHNFVNASTIPETEDYDGSYLTLDSKRQGFFRAGTAATGMVKRWKEHIRASKLTNDNHRASSFYSAYPSEECDIDNLPHKDTIMGSFEQLHQYIGIGMSSVDKDYIVSLFEWNAEKMLGLSKLKGTDINISMIDKQCCHIFYLCEVIYALSINQNRNISGNPGCEWHLGYYRK